MEATQPSKNSIEQSAGELQKDSVDQSPSQINLNENSVEQTNSKSGVTVSNTHLSKNHSVNDGVSLSKQQESKEDEQVKRQSSLMVDTIGDNGKINGSSQNQPLDENSRDVNAISNPSLQKDSNDNQVFESNYSDQRWRQENSDHLTGMHLDANSQNQIGLGF